MASLPSVAINATLKLDSDLRKQHPSLFQSPNVSYSYQKKRSDGAFEPASMDLREALSSMTTTESSYYASLLQQCIDNNSASETRMVHAQIIKTGLSEDSFVSTFLVNVYAKCGTMENARKVLDEMPERNVVAWTTLMTGYAKSSSPETSLGVFREMLLEGTGPTSFTLGIALNACSSLRSVEISEQIHGYAIKHGAESDTSIGNSLCTLYSKLGRLGSAVKAFERVEEKDVISWTAVISACGDNGDASMGLGHFREMVSEGIEPNVFTLTSVLSLCCVTASFGLGVQVHSWAVKLGLASNSRVKNSILYLYLKSGAILEAKRLFDEAGANGLVTWNAMIAGHAQMMEAEGDDVQSYRAGNEALRLFSELSRSGARPDMFTFSSVLTVCAGLVALEQGEQVHACTIKTGFLPDVVLGTSLVNMYNKCGSLERAGRAFVEMRARTLISWTSMITASAQHGEARRALGLFEDMRLVGVRPNHVTFVGVLAACSHAGMVDEAAAYFEMMKREYKIKPVMDHYACLVDMFVRLGRVEEAFGVAEAMEFEPSEFVWSSLVAGCRSHGRAEMGFRAAERLLGLKPRDPEPYLLLLNMYLSAGRWQDVSRVRKMMREGGVERVRDWSWISIREKVYSFKPCDRSHHRSVALYAFLDGLVERAKGVGYQKLEALEVTNDDDDDDDDDEAKIAPSTSYHSEKLAIAFGLLNTPSARPIRVVKNFIMCRDCHEFIKAVSVLTDREITVKDTKRLHKIVNGKCSCGDFGSLL